MACVYLLPQLCQSHTLVKALEKSNTQQDTINFLKKSFNTKSTKGRSVVSSFPINR